MSQEGSPSLLNLRDFRKEKKPMLSHSESCSPTESTNGSSSPVIRKRIIVISSDSDSDCEASNKIITHPGRRRGQRGPSASFGRPQPIYVIERERQIKYLLVTFPKADPLGLHDVLSRHNFDVDSATAELSLRHPVHFYTGGYEQWKKDNGYEDCKRITVPQNISVVEKKQTTAAAAPGRVVTLATSANQQQQHQQQQSQTRTQMTSPQKQQMTSPQKQMTSPHTQLAQSGGSGVSSTVTAASGQPQSFQQSYQQALNNNTSNNNTSSSDSNFKRKMPTDENNKQPKRRKRARRGSSDSEASLEDADGDGGGHQYNDIRVFDSDEDSDVEITDELTGDKRRVLDFMQTATVNELQLMQSCSKKKAEAIVEVRPFDGWIDLVTKLNENKNLSTDLLNAAQQVLITRNNIKNLMKKCTSLAQQMERAVAAGAVLHCQPKTLSVSLKLTNYQMVGVNWLVACHGQRVNGILADEMGLGKTVQVIAFLAYLKETNQAQSTHLVVVPASTLDNWKAEFTRWCPELRVFMYYGTMEERRMFRIDFSKGILRDFDVVLTTYTLVANTPEERKMFRVTPMHYVVFDEAHMLKNMNTQRYENLIRINAKNRILLTGTPLQNNLLELMSLLIFVMPKIFAEKTDDLKSLFQKNSKNSADDDVPTFEKEQIAQAKRIMKPFVLRRLKCDVLQDLPKKIDHVIKVPMAPAQQERYDQLVTLYKNSASNPEVPYNGMSVMTELRKMSNHPLLMRYHYDEAQVKEMAALLARDPTYKETKEDYVEQDLTYMSDFEINKLCMFHRVLEPYILPDNLILTSGKFLHLDRVLAELHQTGHRVLIFSQYVIMLNILEAYLTLKKYKYLRLDGSTPVNERQYLINQYNEDGSILVFLLSTRAGGLGINLTAADTVIIHDIDFNPYNDKQAEDRCHRMGQTRPVTVYRLISKGTIEEGMLEMNQEKLKLERQITQDESDNPDAKNVIRLLSSALCIESNRAAAFVSPNKKEEEGKTT